MVNYYDILKVSPKSSSTEIRSAYRRLARQLHPDRNNGSEATALKFAAIAEAYEVLGNARARTQYDRRLADITASQNGNGDSVFTSNNRHAQRWRRMVYEKRFNDIIDQMLAEERREALALQKFVFTLVALLLSVFVASLLRPDIFLSERLADWPGMLARLVLVTLAAVGIIHIIGRIRDGLDQFTFDDNIHDSVLDETEVPARSYSRYTMTAMVVAGIISCVAGGLALGYWLGLTSISMPYLFAPRPTVDILLYPPMFVLLVAFVHRLILTAEGSA